MKYTFLLRKGSLNHAKVLGMTPKASSRAMEVSSLGEGGSVTPEPLA
jgi:hypothetical protein